MHEVRPSASRGPTATGGATLLTDRAGEAPPGFEIKKGGLGSAGQAAGAGHPVRRPLPHLPRQHDRQRRAGQRPERPPRRASRQLQWVVNGYALTFASFMLAAGMLGDILGRKRIMLAGVAIFCAGSVVAALASNVDWLIAGRVDHGRRRRRQRAGHALHHPARLPRPGDPGRRARGVGRRLGSGARPRAGHRRRARRVLELAGHLLVQPRVRRWWRSSSPLVCVPESSDRQGRRIDVLGFVFGAAFLACMSFAVIQGEDSGYTASWIVALFVLCGLSGVAFVVTERRVKSPMLDLTMFRRAPFAGSNFVAFVAYFGTFSIFFFTALYLQVVVGASAYQTAVDFLPMAAGLIIVSALTGPLVARMGPRWPMTIGCLLAGGGILLAERRARAPRGLRRRSDGCSPSPASASACCWCP